MDRRAFVAGLAGGLFASPLAGEAQRAGKVYRIGFLATGSASVHSFAWKRCGRACVISATSRGRTRSSNYDGPTRSTIGSPAWLPNSCVSKQTSW